MKAVRRSSVGLGARSVPDPPTWTRLLSTVRLQLSTRLLAENGRGTVAGTVASSLPYAKAEALAKRYPSGSATLPLRLRVTECTGGAEHPQRRPRSLSSGTG